MKTYCHHCNRFDECSTYWEKKPNGSKDLVLICLRCATIYAYKFTVYILGRK
jgi:RNase P subunit RPR2